MAPLGAESLRSPAIEVGTIPNIVGGLREVAAREEGI
jgi:hypothetical protein